MLCRWGGDWPHQKRRADVGMPRLPFLPLHLRGLQWALGPPRHPPLLWGADKRSPTPPRPPSPISPVNRPHPPSYPSVLQTLSSGQPPPGAGCPLTPLLLPT